MKVYAYDERRDIAIPGDYEQTLQFCIELFFKVARKAIADHGYFAVALSGGSTPKAIYQGILKAAPQNPIDWNCVLLFWSDERCVPLDHPDSNYKMAMDAGFSKLPIPKENIFPMRGEGDLEKSAKDYEREILEKIPSRSFDLVMLGMGDDGHTASLFPKTHGLHPISGRHVIPNYVPQKDTWRLTLTFECINSASHIVVYVLGKGKAQMVHHVFTTAHDPDTLPIQRVGTAAHKALWIMDRDAAALVE